jgi:serine-type D-Ala-D-Ala carboxypeptidase
VNSLCMSLKEQMVKRRMEEAIQGRVFPGAVFGMVDQTGEKVVISCGRVTYEDTAREVTEDTIYDVASITKSIPLASSFLVLIDQGKVTLEDKVVAYLPEFGNFSGKETVTIKHLLTYTLDLDLPSMSVLKEKSADEIIRTVLQASLRKEPGSSFLYVNATALLLSLVFEKISGKALDIFANEYFFKPLGMNNSTFKPEIFEKARIAPTEIDDWRGAVHGVVHDESTYIINKKYVIGVAGLFSTVPDLLVFQHMLLHNGVHKGKRYLRESIVDEMQKNQINVTGTDTGLGWELNQPQYMGKYAQECYGKTGFTGCLVLNNFRKGMGFTLLSNRIYPKRPADSRAINEVRRAVADIVFG